MNTHGARPCQLALVSPVRNGSLVHITVTTHKMNSPWFSQNKGPTMQMPWQIAKNTSNSKH